MVLHFCRKYYEIEEETADYIAWRCPICGFGYKQKKVLRND